VGSRLSNVPGPCTQTNNHLKALTAKGCKEGEHPPLLGSLEREKRIDATSVGTRSDGDGCVRGGAEGKGAGVPNLRGLDEIIANNGL